MCCKNTVSPLIEQIQGGANRAQINKGWVMSSDIVSWFRYQLKASGEGFIWALQRMDTALYHRIPPAMKYLGEWPPLRHVWHVTEYERCIVLPSMKQWLGGPMPSEESWIDDDAAWSRVKNQTSDDFVTAFQAVRQEQITLLTDLEAVDWAAPHQTLWGVKPLIMVVTKTYQHTFEHGDTLLRMALWWHDIERHILSTAE